MFEQRRRRSAWLVLALAAWLAANSAAADAAAAKPSDLTTKFAIDDADPEAHVPDAREALAAPLQMGYWVMLVSDRAQAASERGDLAAAARYYRAIAKAVPDRAVGFSRACQTYRELGDLGNAARYCRDALNKQGATAQDYAAYVDAMLAKPTPPSGSELAELDAAIGHLASQLAGSGATAADKAFAAQLGCQVAVRLQDATRLQRCTAQLEQLAPRDPKTLGFRFAHALLMQRHDDAANLLEQARALGMPDSGLALMRARLQADRDQASFAHRLRGGHAGLLLLLLGALVLASGLTLLVLRRRSAAHDAGIAARG
jgi:hypothetical protein